MKLDINGTKRVNKKIEHVKITIQSVITSMNGKELERIKVTRTYKNEVNKHKKTSSTYDNKGKEKTSSMYKNK